jgi:hypothetical protein
VTLEMGSSAALLGCVRAGLCAAIGPVAHDQIGEPSALVQIVREHLTARLTAKTS